MKNIIFIAPPAAGKGTQSDLLISKYGYEHISTGDLLREEVASGSELGLNISELMKKGALISDDIVNELLVKALSATTKPFILDGYPRNIKQVDSLIKLFNELNINDYVVIYLDVDYEEAMHRTLGRMICSNCKSSFNKFKEATRPKVDGICDFCGNKLEVRADDTEETFKVRYQTYIEDTKPVLDYFKKVGKLENIKVNDNPQEMLKNIENYLEV